MNNITKERLESELTMYGNICNKILNDMNTTQKNTTDLKLKGKLESRIIGFEKLVNFVFDETQFIKAPASTKYHLAIKHGLLLHSISVAKLAMKMNNTLKAEIPIYKLLTVALFHDLGKENQYVVNQPTNKQKQYGYSANPPFLWNPNQEYNEHESRSLYYLSQYIQLDEDEWVAIQYHNSPWDGTTKCAFKQNKLLTILQMCDYYSTVYLEERE